MSHQTYAYCEIHELKCAKDPVSSLRRKPRAKSLSEKPRLLRVPLPRSTQVRDASEGHMIRIQCGEGHEI